MRFQVLGPVQAWRGDREVDLGTPKQRLLCGALLLEANHFVPLDALVNLLWPDGAPPTARRTVQAYLSRLRAALDVAGDPAHAAALVRRGAGYQLSCDPDTIDAFRFHRLVQEAYGTGDEAAARLLREALALWRGQALADVADDEVRERRWHGLAEARLAAAEQLAEVELRLGRHEGLVDELVELSRQHPYRQRVTGMLMTALHRCGRTVEALRVFDTVRRRLADELGIDPAPELQGLHVAILRADPALVATRARPPASPAQLPGDIADFTGRTATLAQLDALLDVTGAQPVTVVPVAVIAGTAGVGKTALAVHWGQRMRHRFPDGQLYVNLRGFAAERPVRPIDALARFLQALGCPADRVPADLDQAVDAYRTLTADRRILVVLDNAHDGDQVRALLPGGPGCLVLVTSRRSLGGLVAHEGARRVQVEVLAEDEAAQLLERVIGIERVRAEAGATAELGRLCARLPLALRIAAANLVDRPWETITDHVARLRAGDRVAALAVEGDEQMAVGSAFALSYRALPEPARRMFRLLGLIPGQDVSVGAAAALADLGAGAARASLDELATAQLLQQHAPGRYWFHDLLRSYAARQAVAEDDEPQRRTATDRLTWWYERAADAAAQLLYPQRLRLPPVTGGPPAAQLPAFGEPAEAMAWLETERGNLVLVVEHAAAHGPRAVAWRLADTLRGYFWVCMHTVDWLAVGASGVAAAQAEGDPAAQAAARFNLADALVRQSRYRQAAAQFEEALTLAEDADWVPMRSAALGSLGAVYLNAGEPRTAEGYLEQALELAGKADARFTEAVLLGGLGVSRRELGRLESSVEAFDAAMQRFGACGMRQGEMAALAGLGETYHALGRLDRAADCFTRALATLRELGDRGGESDVLPGLAAVERSRGRIGLAAELATSALELAAQINDRRTVANARNVLGSVHHSAGRYTEAAAEYRAVLDLTADSGDRHPQVEAEIGLAGAYRAMARPELALPYARRALDHARASEYRLLADRAAAVLSALGEPAPR